MKRAAIEIQNKTILMKCDKIFSMMRNNIILQTSAKEATHQAT